MSNTLICDGWKNVKPNGKWVNNRKINSIWGTECLCQMLPSTIRTADEFIFRFRMTTKSGQLSKPLPRPLLEIVHSHWKSSFQLESEWREISIILWTSQILISMSRWKIGNHFEPSKLFLGIVSQRKHCAKNEQETTKMPTTEVSESKNFYAVEAIAACTALAKR